VSDVVWSKAAAAAADHWVEALPDLVEELADEWRFIPGRSLDGGTEALVLEVTRFERSAAILKLLFPRDPDSAKHEITVLQLAAAKAVPDSSNMTPPGVLS
jgi:streptomycin 6-kinase